MGKESSTLEGYATPRFVAQGRISRSLVAISGIEEEGCSGSAGGRKEEGRGMLSSTEAGGPFPLLAFPPLGIVSGRHLRPLLAHLASKSRMGGTLTLNHHSLFLSSSPSPFIVLFDRRLGWQTVHGPYHHRSSRIKGPFGPAGRRESCRTR